MKYRTTTLIVALTLVVSASVSAQSRQSDQRMQQVNTLYSTGITAMRQGKYDLAQTNFRKVLKLNPKHAQARHYFFYLQNNKKSLVVNKRKATLKKVIIPKIDLEQVTLQEALDVLKIMIERESKKTASLNFIVRDPTHTFKGRDVSLRLNRVPAEVVLNYIMDQVGGNVRYDNYAMIISPITPKKLDTTEKKSDLIFESP